MVVGVERWTIRPTPRERRERRVVGVEREPHARLLRHRDDPLEEPRKRLPQPLLGDRRLGRVRASFQVATSKPVAVAPRASAARRCADQGTTAIQL